MFKNLLNRKTLRSAVGPVVDQLEGRQLFATALAHGICVNNIHSGNYSELVKDLRSTGTKSVRLWSSFSSYDSRSEQGIYKYINRLASDGFDITLSVVPKGGITTTDSGRVKGLFNYLVNFPGLKNSVDRWEIGNEPDHSTYWRGSLSSYVTNFLKPAYEVLHAAGEKVVSAGPSWNPDDVQEMVDAGMLKYTDFVGYHPYRSDVGDLKKRIGQVKAIVGNKPLVCTEWNVRGHEGDSNKTAWAEEIKEFWPVIRDNFYAAYYYAATKSTTMAGAAGVFTTSGSPNGPFYDAFNSFSKNMGGGYSVSPAASSGSSSSAKPSAPSSTPTNNGNSASSLPSIGLVSLFNSDSDKSITALQSGDTIDLAKLPSRNLGFIATGGGSTQSIKFVSNGKTRVESVAPYSMFGDGNGGRDIFGQKFAAGKYTFSVQAFDKDGAKGNASSTRTFTINFTDSGSSSKGSIGNSASSVSSSGPSIRGFTILDGKTGRAISGLTNLTSSKSISLSSLPTRNIQIIAVASSDTSSVKVGFSGKSSRYENYADWEIFADKSGKATPWYASKGTFTASATPSTADNGRGTTGSTSTISLKFY